MMSAQLRNPSRVITTAAVLVVAGLTACTDDPAQPGSETAVTLQQGLNAYLVVSSPDRPVGTEIWVEARARAAGVELTPTAFVADLLYDVERLEMIDMVSLEDGALRVGNPDAAPGVFRAAGAAANGFDSETLFLVRMKVKAADYIQGLALELSELDVVQNDFAEMSEETAVMKQIIPDGAQVVERQ